MSLNFAVTNIEGYEDSEYNQPPFDAQWHPVTTCIVHRVMHTGLGWELTHKNAAEFYARCKFADRFGGELLILDGKTSEITPQMIKDHIGLTVNVSPETRKTFTERYIRYDFDQWLENYRKETEKYWDELGDGDHSSRRGNG